MTKEEECMQTASVTLCRFDGDLRMAIRATGTIQQGEGAPWSLDSVELAGGGVGGVFGPDVERNRRVRRRIVDDVHHRLE